MQRAGMIQADLARACKVTPPSVNGWLSGKAKFLRGENLLAAAKALNVSQVWLATGKGPMERQPGDEQPITVLSVRPITTYDSLDELEPESTVLITRIDVALSAGSGNGEVEWYIEEREPLPFESSYIRKLRAKPKNLVAIKVDGDSMEPRLFDGDTVVVDRADQRIPANGGVFALVYVKEMLVKRLFALPNGSISVVSDNTAHRSFDVPPEDVERISIIGRVKYRSGTGDF
jgi:phage repressor protein C with HTH and peptisase S24 domain